MSQGWRSRIVGQDSVAPDTLLQNPLNWRVHPKHQQQALEAALDAVGWIQQVLVNRTTGHMIDGHARVQLALRRKEPAVPVLYVELTPDEERAAIASLDPLSALAVTDPEALFAAVANLETGNTAFDAFLASQRSMADEARVRPEGRHELLTHDKKAIVKMVFPAGEHLALVERALAATGQVNRGEALAVLARSYLDQTGQHHLDAQGRVAAVPTVPNSEGPGRVRNPRRRGQGVGSGL